VKTPMVGGGEIVVFDGILEVRKGNLLKTQKGGARTETKLKWSGGRQVTYPAGLKPPSNLCHVRQGQRGKDTVIRGGSIDNSVYSIGIWKTPMFEEWVWVELETVRGDRGQEGGGMDLPSARKA